MYVCVCVCVCVFDPLTSQKKLRLSPRPEHIYFAKYTHKGLIVIII